MLRANFCPPDMAEKWDAEAASFYSRELSRALHGESREILTLPGGSGGCLLQSAVATAAPAQHNHFSLLAACATAGHDAVGLLLSNGFAAAAASPFRRPLASIVSRRAAVSLLVASCRRVVTIIA